MAAALDIAGGQIGIFKVLHHHCIIRNNFGLRHYDVIVSPAGSHRSSGYG